ncbi:MAG: DUF2867 domain-containing protein [Candidatus Schmidhempelia sp.]|nr:DUF2867 domain-containing protein [Candidatus Schmidhempelia sp.]
MRIKQKVITKIISELPTDITLVAKDIDYLSYQKLDIPKNMTAYEAYKMMTSHQPRWLKILFKTRDFLVKPIGVRAIKGFDEKKVDEDKNIVDFFTIIEKTKVKLTLIVKDSHLDVGICIRIINKNRMENTLYLIASVKNHNIWGKLYMLPVAMIHPYIVNKLFKNINN